VTHIIGVSFYNKYLRDIEVRKIFMIGTFLGISCAWSTWMFAMRINIKLGIPDMLYVMMT
jgi:hypothetical protein